MSNGLRSFFTFVLLLPSETLEINSIPDIALFALVHRVGCVELRDECQFRDTHIKLNFMTYRYAEAGSESAD